MLGFRRRYLALLVILVSLWSCDPYRLAPPPAPGATAAINAIVTTIRSNPPPPAEFIDSFGMTNARITDKWTLPWNHQTGSIHPHVNSHRDSLFNGKVLARIYVNEQYGNLQPNVWYYWVVVDTSVARVGKLASLYVPQNAEVPHFIGHLSVRLHNRRHNDPAAAWVTGSDGVGWASCSMYGCCCGDQHCEKRGGP